MAKIIDRYIDPDFPPNKSSLDGRKKSLHSDEEITKCPCRLPTMAKTVQSDGPNYGRFYFCCGKSQLRQKLNTEGKKANICCKFFKWDDQNGSKGAGYDTRYSKMSWEFFGDNRKHVIVRNNSFSPDAVRQGAVGNCWFLSALALVAEKEYLVRQLLPHTELNEKGCYQVNLCLDGKWEPIIVDSHLPVVFGGRIVDPLRGGTTSSQDMDTTVHPAFCAVPKGQLWPALIEKAYAKVHGSYEQLSGGFIQEGFQDMTGAPTETLVFHGKDCNSEDLWARLLSFHEAGFLMGVATSKGGDGLVGGHAYSVLDVLELHDMLVGEQQSMKDFLQGTCARKKKKQKVTIRLIRIRNPWGKKEWKGRWSANSETWTRAIRKQLGSQTYNKGDGTFYMSFNDMLERFHHMDVVKCRKGWMHTCNDGRFLCSRDPLKSSSNFFGLNVTENTYAFISIIQPKKRANTKSQYWYKDPSFMVIKRRNNDKEWRLEKAVICGTMRQSTLEIFLEPLWDYCVLPFSCESNNTFPFRLSSYSGKNVHITQHTNDHIPSTVMLSNLHKYLLEKKQKLHYPVAKQSVLICIRGEKYMYFLAINASHDRLLSLRLSVKLQKGLKLSYGNSGEVYDVPNLSQRILMVVSSDGTQSSAISFAFSYASDMVQISHPNHLMHRTESKFDSPISLSQAGKSLACLATDDCEQKKGGDTIDTFQWLSQIGSLTL